MINQIHKVQFKYFPIVLTLFSSTLLISNIAAIKLIQVFGITLTASFFFFPFNYVLNCILVEVYGYKNTRTAIWCGFLLNIIYVIVINISAILPPSPHWNLTKEFNDIIIPETRIVFASLISYLIADFTGSYILAKEKIKNTSSLFMRVVKASFISIFISIVTFIGIAFYSLYPTHVVLQLMFFAFLKKIIFQLLLFPITALAITQLKKIEDFEPDDSETAFTPFSLNNVYNFKDYQVRKLTLTTK